MTKQSAEWGDLYNLLREWALENLISDYKSFAEDVVQYAKDSTESEDWSDDPDED